jgi:hypothetical protein
LPDYKCFIDGRSYRILYDKVNIVTAAIVRCPKRKIQVKFFFLTFLHHLIERELLITKIYFLALVNASFQSKNTTYSKSVVFFNKTPLFQNVQNFLLSPSCKVLKLFFSASASKMEYKKVVKPTTDPKIYWCWRFESRRVHYVFVDFVNLSSFSM